MKLYLLRLLTHGGGGLILDKASRLRLMFHSFDEWSSTSNGVQVVVCSYSPRIYYRAMSTRTLMVWLLPPIAAFRSRSIDSID
jgi:hypothetical protein